MIAKNIIKTIFLQHRNFSQKTVTKVQTSNGIKTITLSDEIKRNSLSIEMMNDLIKNINANKTDPNLRVILIEAIGPVFSAGHNMKELGLEAKTQRKVFDLGSELMNSVIDSPVPIIAVIKDQIAAAAGCQLVAQCDLALCTEKSSFSTPGVKYGIFCSTPGVALARNIPKTHSLKMLLTGEAIDGKEAHRIGLVTEACSIEEIEHRVQYYCESIKKKSRSVIELGKKFYYQQTIMNVKDAYKIGGLKMVENLDMQDGKEGVASFIEKRKPKWSK